MQVVDVRIHLINVFEVILACIFSVSAEPMHTLWLESLH